MTYAEKLKDPRWQKRRLEIFQRDSFMCMNCGDEENTLNVHHKSYHGEPWEAPDKSLITLCETCHKEETENIKIHVSDCISDLKKNGFTSVSFYSLAKVFNTDRGWDSFEPAFDIIKLAIDDDEIWELLTELYFKRLRQRNAHKWV